MIDLTAAALDFLSEITETTIVDFWAEWCGPCHAVSPLLEKLAQENEMTLLKVNIDEQPELAQAFGVMSIPTILYVEDGEVQRKVVGALPRAQMEEELLGITR